LAAKEEAKNNRKRILYDLYDGVCLLARDSQHDEKAGKNEIVVFALDFSFGALEERASGRNSLQSVLENGPKSFAVTLKNDLQRRSHAKVWMRSI